MANKKDKRVDDAKKAYDNEKYRTSGFENGIPGINTPGIELPAYNPPVPNRAWTEMRRKMGDPTMKTPEAPNVTDPDIAKNPGYTEG